MPAGTPANKKATPRAAANATASKSGAGTSPAAAASKPAAGTGSAGTASAGTASKPPAGAPSAAAVSKSATAAAPAASSKSTSSGTDKKTAAPSGGTSAAVAHAASKSGSSSKTPRKSGEGSPVSGRRTSNSSTGTSGGLEKSPKATKTGATPRTPAATHKQGAAAVPAADASAKEEDFSVVEQQSRPVSAEAPAPEEASSRAACPVAAAADDGGVGSSAHEDATKHASEDAGDAATSRCEVECAPVRDTLTTTTTTACTTPLIYILGPPCSGKGTLSSLLKQQLGLQHTSTGTLLREAAKEQGEDSEIGEVLKSGGLVPDDVVANLLKKAVEGRTNCKGVVLDGFPRNAEQVKLINDPPLYPGIFFVLKVAPEVLLRRMAARRVDLDTGEVFGEGSEPQDEEQRQRLVQRDDDKPEILQKRLDEYAEKADSILCSLSNIGGIAQAEQQGTTPTDTEQQQTTGQHQRFRIVDVDGDRDIQLIFEEVSAVLKSSFPTIS